MQKVALITGSARRIGAAVATYLHSHGFKIIIHCNNSLPAARILSDELNRIRADSAKVIQASLDSKDNIEKLIQDSFNWENRLDVIVNNASIFSKNLNKMDEMWSINVKAPYILNNLAYKYLQAVKGSIINITDTHARKPIKGYPIYCQTKAALRMQTKALALEFSPDVRVNAVAPGAILWPEGENDLSEDKKQFIISNTLLKKHGDPVNIAKAVLSLIDNDFITGHEIVVDGGRNI